MGNYLAQPNCSKESGSGASKRVAYGVSSMQGWRVSMEDAHLIHHKFLPPTHTQWPKRSTDDESRRLHLFGIFDGHGGPQVAQFVSTTLVQELIQSPQFAEGNFEIAFKVAYCNIDRLLRSSDWTSLQRENNQTQKTSSHCILSGARPCTNCGCCVPSNPHDAETDTTDQTPSENRTEEILPTALQLTTAVAEMYPTSATLMGSLTHGIKHVWGHVWSATSKLGNHLMAGTNGTNPPLLHSKSLKDNPSSNPAMYTGCTAISALLVENVLYIANAGDSRAVLCRGGRAEVLSQDHKPNLPEERQRIYAAGGFVEYGRVNGNLNLSRALGDLIYKQDMGLAPERQIVTGYPEVRRVDLLPEDEFIIIGCDGIWEYFSSQDVIDFVRARLRKQDGLDVISSSSSQDYAPRPHKSTEEGPRLLSEESVECVGVNLSKILEKLFESLISPNPSLFEYGCDNMTAILIDLRPGLTCGCRCHQIQREVYDQIFPRKVSTSSTMEISDD